MSDVILNPEPKKWYESKMVLTNIIMGLAMMVSYFLPGVAEFLQVHFAEAGMGWALLNVILRLITKTEIK